jgi:hypothetical protein
MKYTGNGEAKRSGPRGLTIIGASNSLRTKESFHYAIGPRVYIERHLGDFMTITEKQAASLPKELRTAQEAIRLPEVQEMMRKLSVYNLGVFMPHMHDDNGRFQPSSEKFVQVESGMRVTFAPTEDVMNEEERYLPVGWVWNANVPTPMAMCKQVCEVREGDTMHWDKHDKTDDE